MIYSQISALFLFFGYDKVILVDKGSSVGLPVMLEKFNIKSYLVQIPPKERVMIIDAKTRTPVKLVIDNSHYLEFDCMYIKEENIVFDVSVHTAFSIHGFKGLTLDEVKAIMMDLQIEAKQQNLKKWMDIIRKIV